MSIKVLLDTDIGSDIDDAICLAYLLAQPQCELLGITTVTGEADRRAMLASVLCKVAGKYIPIFPGSQEPLSGSQKQPYAPQAAALSKWDHEKQFPQGQATEFLRQTIYRYPGEVFLLTIGPLTNIGLLFQADPKIPSMLKGIVMMCGVFTEHQIKVSTVEWNAACDPLAADIVYQAGVKIHRSVGLDVTKQVTMDARQFRERFCYDLHRPVLDFAEIWFGKRAIVTFHDPLAGATIFDEWICLFQKGTVEVELKDGVMRGRTYWKPHESGKHEVAVGVDARRFFREYFSVFHDLGK